MKLRMLNPQTGGIGELEPDRLSEALADGLQLQQDAVELYNPESKGVGKVPADRVREALSDGLIPVGSSAHRQAGVGKLESGLRGAAQSATLNFADEIAAGAESLFTDKTYDQALAESRANFKDAEAANPNTYLAGQLGGGLTSALIPGLGAGNVAKAGGIGAKMLAAGKLGAILGGASELGASEDKSIMDVVEGAGIGAVAGGLGEGVMAGLGAGAGKIGGALKEAIDPEKQLLLAAGVRASEMDPSKLKSGRIVDAVKKFQSEGGFDSIPGKSLTADDLFERVKGNLASKGEAIGAELEKAGNAGTVSSKFNATLQDIKSKLEARLADALPSERSAAQGDLDYLLGRIEASQGNVSDLWKLKSLTGSMASEAFNNPSKAGVLKKGLMDINSSLDELVTAELGTSALNKSYSASKTLEPILGRNVGKDAASNAIGLKDLATGSVAGAASAAGGLTGGLSSLVGLGATVGGKYLNSIEGRVARANLGQKLDTIVQQQSVAMGAIPRTTAGVKDFLKKNFQSLPPDIQQAANAIIGAPPDRAEQMIRAAMPAFVGQFAKTKYPSELDGRVSAFEDKQAITKELHKLKLPASKMALKVSALNKDGTIPADVYDPADYEDEMQQFATKMMGGR